MMRANDHTHDVPGRQALDAERFDTLAKALTGTKSRRSALGAAVAGGVLSALRLNQGPAVRAAQDDRCEVPGAGGTCVLDFEAIVREGPSASQPLVAGGSPGRLRGYLMFTRGRTGSLEDAKLLLDDGSSLPVSGLAIGQGFQARIDFGQGQALVAVGVGEPDVVRCLGRLDGTVTSTVTGDLGEWHAITGVQNIPGAGAQSTGNGNRPASNSSGSGSQLAQGNTTTGGGNASNGETGNRPVAETSGNQSGSNSGGSGGGSNGTNGSSSPGTSGSDRPANGASGSRPVGETDDDRASVEARQGVDDDEMVLACPESQTRCGSACVNLQTDAINCGQCGTVCARSEECLAGICAETEGETACPEGQTRCSNACVNTTTDVLNCGACDRICALDEECTGGQCLAIAEQDDDEEECEAGQTRCGEICTDLQTDETNCGACGTTCAADEACVGGKCTPPAPVLCPEGQVRCDGICKEALPNFGTEGISCPGGGSVPTECPAARVLCNGACFPEGACQPTECRPGWGYCYGVCRDFQSDPGYCGNCVTACPGGVCQNGRCFLCPEGHLPCGGICVNVQTDVDNCGFCGSRCGTQCIDGQCTAVGPTPGCSPGTTRCGNVCVDLTRDPAHCGACGNICEANDECVPPGKCQQSQAYCDTLGMRACGNACVDKDHPEHCGGCFLVCPGGYACDSVLEICYIIGGSKRDGVKPTQRQSLEPADQQTLAPTDELTCAPGLEECDGVCSDLTADTFNCGTCGNACDTGATCQQGECSTPGSSSSDQPLEPADTEPPAEPETTNSESETEPSSTTCPEGRADCGGVCADLTVDPLNCGTCGVACAPGSSCDLGVCSEPAAPIAPEAVDQAVPADEPVEPIAPSETTDGEPEP